MRHFYEVYANGFPSGTQFKVTQFSDPDEAIEYAKNLIEINNRPFINTIHTSVLKITRENYWDSENPTTTSK